MDAKEKIITHTSNDDIVYYHGQPFSAKIQNVLAEGKISIYAHQIYLCQDSVNGSTCPEKFGYRYSYTINDGSRLDLGNNSVTDLSLITNTSSKTANPTCTFCLADIEKGKEKIISEGFKMRPCTPCYNRRYTPCSVCTTDVKKTNVVKDALGVKYCIVCYKAKYFKCRHCSCEFLQKDNHQRSHHCTPCFNLVYIPCASCQRITNRGNLSAERFCSPCYTIYQEEQKIIKNHSYKPHKHLYFVTGKEELTIGLEVEVEKKNSILSPQDMAQKIKKQIGDFAYFKRDGSLECGFEVVTHPFSYEWLKSNRNIFDFLSLLSDNKYRSYNTETCGIHIHLSKKSFGNWHLYKFMDFFMRNKLFILRISQRKEAALKRWATLDALAKKKIIQYAKSKYQQENKYTALNLLPEHTVEMRIFRGNLNKVSFFKNIEFAVALFYFTRDSRQEDNNEANFTKYISDNRKEYPNLFAWLLGKDEIANDNEIIPPNLFSGEVKQAPSTMTINGTNFSTISGNIIGRQTIGEYIDMIIPPTNTPTPQE